MSGTALPYIDPPPLGAPSRTAVPALHYYSGPAAPSSICAVCAMDNPAGGLGLAFGVTTVGPLRVCGAHVKRALKLIAGEEEDVD